MNAFLGVKTGCSRRFYLTSEKLSLLLIEQRGFVTGLLLFLVQPFDSNRVQADGGGFWF